MQYYSSSIESASNCCSINQVARYVDLLWLHIFLSADVIFSWCTRDIGLGGIFLSYNDKNDNKLAICSCSRFLPKSRDV